MIINTPNKHYFTIIIIAIVINSLSLFADDRHHIHCNEIGFSVDYINLNQENKKGLGLHLHFTRHLSENDILSYFGLGIGLESIFSDHNHYGFMGSLLIYPFNDFVCSISPGLVISDHNDNFIKKYTTHFEVSYGFYIKNIEIGPVIGYSYSSEDNHYSAGIHFAKSF